MQHLCQSICTYFVQIVINYRASNKNMHFSSAYLENFVFFEYETRNLQMNDLLQM